MSNVDYLHRIGMTGRDVVLAHCIHLTEHEIELLVETGTAIVHCPGSNLKLASGIASIPTFIRNGSRLAIGSDGAPCNNRMDAFAEMRLAALIQKPEHGADIVQAADILDLATFNGANVLNTGGGDLVEGAAADIVALDPKMPHSLGGGAPSGMVVYSMTPANVRHVWVDGALVVQNQQVLAWDWNDTADGCTRALERVRKRTRL
jgi:5-methylthioadenosine/S-adenosylhomocysteine deaminase